MARAKLKYVVNEKGRRIGVILDIASYRDLLKEIAQLKDALEHGTAAPSTTNPSFISSGRSGRSDISVNHDEALAEDFK